jgi:hypothetical protein
MRDLYRSTDGGATFINVTKGYTAEDDFDPANSTAHVDQHSFAFHPFDSQTIYLGNDGGIFLSHNGGTTYQSLSDAIPIVQAYGIAAHPLDPSTIFLGTQDNGLERRGPNGRWLELITGDYGSILFDRNDPDVFATNYIYGTLMSFRGVSYLATLATNATFGEPEDNPRIAFIAPFERSQVTNTLYFGTWKLYASNNGGTSWTLPGGPVNLTYGSADKLGAIGLSPNNGSVIYTGSYEGRVMMSRNAGATWTDVSFGLPTRAVRAIAVDRNNPDLEYAGFSGYATQHVWRTTNGGASWQNISAGLPDIPVNALLIDPSNSSILYAGTDIGVFRYSGSSWSYYSTGMPPVMVTDFDVTASGRIIAATHGRGAYELVKRSTNRRRGVRK